MKALDPKKLFRRLADDIPGALRRHIFVVGSLAAAYHFRSELKSRAVNTKDADLVLYPAGDVRSAKALAGKLLDLGWTRTDQCYPQERRNPVGTLRAFRLNPPGSRDYFIELLGLPGPGQSKRLVWVPVRLSEGWYGVGCFRFMRLNSLGRLKSSEGLEYASPAMMALSNLLSHPQLDRGRMTDPVGGRKLLRSAKDLGRVLSLAWLSGRTETEAWLDAWILALRECFPNRWRTLARTAGRGLHELLENSAALEEAHFASQSGLLSGKGVTLENLRAVGTQLQKDLIRPLVVSANRSRP